MKLSTLSVTQLALKIVEADDAITACYAMNNLPTFSPEKKVKLLRLRKVLDELERQIAAKVIAIRAQSNDDSGDLDFIAQGVIDALLKREKLL